MAIKKLRKNPIKFLVVLVSLGLIFSIITRFVFGGINDYISELGVVYTPQKTAFRFHYQILSIDTFEYWVFKLKDEEEKIILDEVKNGNWVEMNSDHVGKLEYFDEYKKIFGNSYKNHKCYICIYDDRQNDFITNSSNEIWQDTTKWIIFLYDTESNCYYCVYETV